MGISKLMNKSFLTRLTSALVLVVVILTTFLAGNYVMFGFTLLLSLVGLAEIYKTVGIQKRLLGILGYISVVVYYATVFVADTEYMGSFIIGWLMVVMIVFVFSYPKYKAEEILMAFFGVVYVAILMSFLFLIRERTEDGMMTIWLVMISSWICDTFAYLFGVMFGKHKMTPILSPKKTVEGAIGGVLGAAGIGALYGWIVAEYLGHFANAPLHFAILCACASLLSMVGDLAASAIKRCYDIKDYGKLIPGHGGVLDRFDSVLFTAPVIYYLIIYIF